MLGGACGEKLLPRQIDLQFLELLVACTQCTASIYLFYLSSLSSPLLAVAMAFTRSVTSILRTSRLAACSSRHVNPINRVFGHDRFAARTYATVFERTKPHVNIGKGKPLIPAKSMLTTRRDNRSRRSRQGMRSQVFPSIIPNCLDHPHSRNHQKTVRARLRKVLRIWCNRQSPRRTEAWYHNFHSSYRI